MKENSFKKLQDLQEEEFSTKSKNVKNNIDTEVSLFQFVGDVIELYCSKSIDYMVNISNQYESKK